MLLLSIPYRLFECLQKTHPCVLNRIRVDIICSQVIHTHSGIVYPYNYVNKPRVSRSSRSLYDLKLRNEFLNCNRSKDKMGFGEIWHLYDTDIFSNADRITFQRNLTYSPPPSLAKTNSHPNVRAIIYFESSCIH